MNARELLTQAQIDRSEQTRLAEEFERGNGRTITQFQPTANTADGVVGKTANGGQLTVFNGAQNFDPSLGESYQLQITSGRASLVANSKAQETTLDTTIVNAIVATRSPTTDDPGQRGQLWLNVNQPVEGGIRVAETWAFVSQLGAWHRISGDSIGNISSGEVYPVAVYEVSDDTSLWPVNQTSIVRPISILASPSAAINLGNLIQIASPNYFYVRFGAKFAGIPDDAAISAIDVNLVNSLDNNREMAAIIAIEDNTPDIAGVSTTGTMVDAFLTGPNITTSGTTGISLTRQPGATSYQEILDSGRLSFPVPAFAANVGTTKAFRYRSFPVGLTGAQLKRLIVQIRSTGAVTNAAFISCSVSIY